MGEAERYIIYIEKTMTIASKENIPIATTAINFNESSPSSTTVCLDPTVTTALVKADIVAVTDLSTMESIAPGTIENSVTKKRLIAETLATPERHDIDGSTGVDNVAEDDKDKGDDDMNESRAELSILLNSSNDIINTTDQDQQQELQVMSDDVNNNPTKPETAVNTVNGTAGTSSEVTQSEEGITIDLQRPVKRARTAYFLFLDDYRSTVQKEVCANWAHLQYLGYDHFILINFSCYLLEN
jgi:hypothetical protein